MLVGLCFFGSVFGGVTSLLEARSRREYMGVFRSKGSPSVGSPADFASQRWFRGAFKAPYGVVSLPSVPAGQCLWLWASLSMRCTVLCDHSVPISGGCVTGGSVSHGKPGVPRAFIGCCEPVERHVALWGSIVEYDGGCFYFLVEVVEVFS